MDERAGILDRQLRLSLFRMGLLAGWEHAATGKKVERPLFEDRDWNAGYQWGIGSYEGAIVVYKDRLEGISTVFPGGWT